MQNMWQVLALHRESFEGYEMSTQGLPAMVSPTVLHGIRRLHISNHPCSAVHRDKGYLQNCHFKYSI